MTTRAEVLPPDELGDLLVVLGLQLQRGDPPPVGERHLHLTGAVPAHVPDRPDRILQREVAHRYAGLDQPQHQFRRADLQQGRRLAHVGVADDDVQPAVTLGVGMRLVAGVDDRPAPGGRRRHALPDVLGPLADAVLRTPRGVQHLARPADQLPGDQERHQHVGDLGEVADPGDQVVLVAAVGVAVAVGVVLEQVDVTADAFARQPLLGVDDQVLEDAFAGPVMVDQLHQVVALGGGVLRVRSDVEVDARSVAQEDIAAPAPGHHAAEEIARDFVGGEPPGAARRARDPVLGLQPVDPPVHVYPSARPRRDVPARTAQRPVSRRSDPAAHRARRGSALGTLRP